MNFGFAQGLFDGFVFILVFPGFAFLVIFFSGIIGLPLGTFSGFSRKDFRMVPGFAYLVICFR